MNAEIVAALEKEFPEVPGLEEVQNCLDAILTAYKNESSLHSRTEIHGLLMELTYRVAHSGPEGYEPDKT